jgi:hypothetical protein
MKPIQNKILRLLAGRILIGLVVFSNLQCALAFLIHPGSYALAYELSGIPGQAAVRGFAILFCMWNIPYFFALVHPIRYRISLLESVLMQATGLVGESWLVCQVPLQNTVLRGSIYKFIVFDGAGLLLLLIAALITRGIDQSTKYLSINPQIV